MARILIVDDEQGIRSALAQVLEYEGHEVRTAADGKEGLELATDFLPDLIFLDVKMPGADGLEVLADLRVWDPAAAVVMISGHGTIDTAMEAIRAGARDFLEKPLDTDRLLLTIRNALEVRGLQEKVARMRGDFESRYRIVGNSPALRTILDVIERVSPTNARVLITGENGTGKELVARAVHRRSKRARGPFIEVNCAAIPSELIESTLFGHVKGSFTGAIASATGKFVQADGGTLFLDEVGDMSLDAQAKVLRALQEGEVTPVGGTRKRKVDVRVLTATNRDLGTAIREGHFREDLYYRLNVVPVKVPTLGERREDIPMLVAHFAESMADEGRRRLRFTEKAVEILTGMPWPGNVRQLRNTVERLLILAPGDRVTAADVRLWASEGARGAETDFFLEAETLAEFKEVSERAFLVGKLRVHGWNVAETARALDMQRSNLYKKIERHGLSREG